MRKSLPLILLTLPLSLGGCATYGLGGGGDGGLLGDIFGGNDNYDYRGGNSFERSAVSACGREAERYGRVTVDRAEQRDRDYVYVTGRIGSRDRRSDSFTCIYREDGRIVDFRRD